MYKLQECNAVQGLFFKCPRLFSSASIFCQPSNGITAEFLLSSSWRRPSLPGFDEPGVDGRIPFLISSEMLAACHESRVHWTFSIGYKL
nr:hypothetical protein Iba_scaffold450916CG0010 [Ipomoea batatas]